MIRRPQRSTLSSSSAASDVYKRQTSYPSKVNMTSTSQRSQEIRSAETVREIYEMNGVFFDDDANAKETNSKARARQRVVMGLDGTPSCLLYTSPSPRDS
eukprot:TRINITY_DN34649_c0_g1_i1.p1 TRINITY_DN34649_c0_g1~~TRINITY_DN34649_c0_g1_i1.p1  ORF type:complete len:100 (+),score=20.89 TRINITY_DN34649_c0_g1_i1:56-355(+)